MALVQYEGRYRGVVKEIGLEDTQDTQSVFVKMDIESGSFYYPDKKDWGDIDFVLIPTSIVLVKKDGSLNQGGVDQLKTALGWDGDLEKLNGGLRGITVQVEVKEDTWNGKTKMKGSWIHHGESIPGGRTINNDKINNLSSRFGSQLRAICGGSTAKPTGPAPSVPAPPSKGPPPAAASPTTTEDEKPPY